MKPRIVTPDPSSEFHTAERCWILESWNDDADPEVSIARVRVAPAVRTALHRLDGTAERYVIVEGRGRMEVADLQPRVVGPGDVVVIPAGEPQRIENVGDGDLVFYCVCTPAFHPDCYVDLES